MGFLGCRMPTLFVRRSLPPHSCRPLSFGFAYPKDVVFMSMGWTSKAKFFISDSTGTFFAIIQEI